MAEIGRLSWSLALPIVVVVAILMLLLASAAGLTQGLASTSASSGATQSAAVVGTMSTSIAPQPGPMIVCGQAKIPLGAAGNFRVLAGTTVTNTGATVITGNLGVSPGSAVTGFPPGKVTGAIDKANTASAAGEKALGTAYKTGMGRTNCPIKVAGNIGGKTLKPGLYKSTSSLAISSGDLTLSAKGHAGGVWVFQVASKLTVSNGLKVILAGGASASNIFWVVGSSVTLGTTSVMYGIILAHKSISLATGAVLHGRALANIGAVTLAGDKVSATPFAAAPAVATLPVPTMARPFL
jgi:hypothetical protein